MAQSVRRKKDSSATRNAILEAARVAFTNSGYEAIGLREIAGGAGVSAALVNRYFGGKEALFEAAVPSQFSIVELLEGPREELGDRIVGHLAEKTKDAGSFDPTVAMLRSASSAEAREMLQRGLDEKIVGPLAAWLGGVDAGARAGMIVALLAGYSVLVDVLALDSLQGASLTTARRTLAALIQQIVNDQI